jgi:predicted DsbA family dithiol-disulfide isomerase
MSDTTAATQVRVYADYVCPFCYLGYESFDRYRQTREEPLSTEWHPFDLRGQQRRPDGSIDDSVDTGKDEAYYEKARQNVQRLAERYDVEMTLELAEDVDSYPAQRVAVRARDTHPEAFETFHRGVFDALWEAGRDIGAPDVLADVATTAGLPAEFVEDTLADGSTAETLETAFETARERRITGVPTFVADDHAARGAVPPEQLRRLIEGT